MSSLRTLIKVFVASPTDVQAERRRLLSIVDELNRTVAEDRGFVLELVRWETHSLPGMGRPQAVVDASIGPFDVFVGVMWKRFGTPTGKAESGTEEEFQSAYRQWELTRRPQILFYFSDASYSLRSAGEAEQLQRVLEFRSKIQALGLVRAYKGPSEFERLVREHLSRLLSHWDPATPPTEVEVRAVTPVQELFESAVAEWKRFGLYASRDRLDLFRANHEDLELADEGFRFLVLSILKLRPYEPWTQLRGLNEMAVAVLARHVIERALNDPDEVDEDIAYGAIRVLADTVDAASVDLLSKVMGSGLSYDVRSNAVHAFWFSRIREAATPALCDRLMEILRTSPDWRMRKDAAYALGSTKCDAVDSLIAALADPRAQVRADAIDALARGRDKRAILALIDMARTEYSRLALKRLVWALSTYRSDPAAGDALRHLATVNDAVVAENARAALEVLRP